MVVVPNFEGLEQMKKRTGRFDPIKSLLSLPIWYLGWLIVYPSETVYYSLNPAALQAFLGGVPASVYFACVALGVVVIEAHERIHVKYYRRRGLDVEYRRMKGYVIAPEQLHAIEIWSKTAIAPLVVISVVSLLVYLSLAVFVGGWVAFLPAFIFTFNLSGSAGDLVDFIAHRRMPDDIKIWSADADGIEIVYYRPED